MFDVNFSKLKVLVVDDSRTMRSILIAMLGDMGIKCISEAEDGADAIIRLKEDSPDFVICDLNMTPLDGIEFTKLVRNSKDSPNPFVPIVALTSEATEEKFKQALTAGVHSFLTKPVTFDTLRSRISHVLQTPQTFVKEGKFMVPRRLETEPA